MALYRGCFRNVRKKDLGPLDRFLAIFEIFDQNQKFLPRGGRFLVHLTRIYFLVQEQFLGHKNGFLVQLSEILVSNRIFDLPPETFWGSKRICLLPDLPKAQSPKAVKRRLSQKMPKCRGYRKKFCTSQKILEGDFCADSRHRSKSRRKCAST